MNKKNLAIFLTIALGLASKTNAQVISENGWYFPKAPMTGVWGYPFIIEKNEETFVGSVKEIDPNLIKTNLAKYDGTSYSKIFESSWKKILLGNLYNRVKNVELTVEAFESKRWILSRKILTEFSPNSYYAVEGLSADSIKLTCKVSKKTDVDSKSVEDILGKYLKSNTVVFEIMSGLTKNKIDTLKGLLQFTKKDSSEFQITIKNPDVIYAIKYGKLTQTTKQYFYVQQGIKKPKKVDLNNSNKLNYTVLNFPYQPDRNSGIIRTYLNITRQRLDDKSPKLVGYTINTFENNKTDTLFIETGKDIGNNIIRYEGETFNSMLYSGNKKLNINFSYNIDYNKTTGEITIAGKNKSTGEFENCLYGMESDFILYP